MSPRPKERPERLVLFLDSGDLARGKQAQACFSGVAARLGLPFRSELRQLGASASARDGQPATAADWHAAWRVVVVDRQEQLPLLRQRHPDWLGLPTGEPSSAGKAADEPACEKLESWEIGAGLSSEETARGIESEVMDLAARLLAGGSPRPERSSIAAGSIATAASPGLPAAKPARAEKPPLLKVGRETSGRRGKGGTTVFDTPLDDEALRNLAATLKQRCGTGGTVKDGRIEIQGDQRERIVAELEKLGYRVKRVGG